MEPIRPDYQGAWIGGIVFGAVDAELAVAEWGIDNTDADLVVLCEPDGTFSAHDLQKLLAYSDDKPVVFGTRTSPEFIWAGANMGRFLRWGNWAVAKMTEMVFNTSILTDMGCTFRLLRREALTLIRPHLTIGGSHFGPQILLEVIAHRIPFVEIPLNYCPRVGTSSVTGSLWTAFWLGMRMIVLVLSYRLGLYRRERIVWDETLMAASMSKLASPAESARGWRSNGAPSAATRHDWPSGSSTHS